jgi:hypothetical protein
VPFDLHISRGSAAAAITSDEFHAAMQGAPATRKADHLYWVRHPEGDPWFAAAWSREGRVALSTSYSNHRYLRNFADMFDMGLRLVRGLGARLFEEVGHREVTPTNIDSLLAPDGEYVRLQASTWRGAREQLSAHAKAPLEYPLGPVDLVPEYLLFHVVPERVVADDSIAVSLGRSRRGVTVQKADERAWRLVDAASGNGLTKVLHRSDGKWQVWPAWGLSPFAAPAQTTVAVAEQLHHVAGGEIQLLGRTFDEALRNDVLSRLGGLGVEFYEWIERLPSQ